MCTATDLKKASYKLRNAGERKSVSDIADRMQHGKAKDHEVEWAKRITVGVRKALRQHTPA